ncbi:MAG: hypothetical protein VW080_05335 [Flavobacteriaceae bacterium]
MKNIFLLSIVLLSIQTLSAQANNNGYGIGSNGVQSDSRLIDLFENIKNRANSSTANALNKTKGSPYFEENFQKAQVEYFGNVLKDEIYLRYNAFSDEMEMSSIPNPKSSDNILIKNNKVSCVMDGSTYRYLGFIKENQPPSVGYVKELFKGKVFSFYERKSKAYMEATVARTSLERSFPARFVDKTDYFYSIENGSLMEVKLSKKKISSALKSYSGEIKSFLSNSKMKLKNPEEVIQLLNYLETI